MAEALISAGAAIIVGLFSLIGVAITNLKTGRDLQRKMSVSQAVTETKIDTLTTEVREYTHLARRLPVVEEQLRIANHRIEHLERINERSGLQ